MKKTAAALLMWLLFGASKPQPPRASDNLVPDTIVSEVLFVNIVRDMELLNSWLVGKRYPKEAVALLFYKSYQEILALYEVDQQSFEESSKYYVAYSTERALKIYEKIYTALKELLPSV